jgi:hypothetical protein
VKTAKEVMCDGRTFTLITCCDCGNQTSVSGRSTSKKAQAAIDRKCRPCNPVIRQGGTNWWSKLGLHKNPYVFGPMPYKRTGERWRLEEARRMGWLAWYWVDEYTDERMRK